MLERLKTFKAGLMSEGTAFASTLCRGFSNVTEYLGFESTTEKLRTASEKLGEKHEVWAKRERLYRGVERSDVDLVFKPDNPIEHDHELIEKTVDNLYSRYPNGIGKELAGQSQTERYETFVKEFKIAAETLGVEVNDFYVFFPETEDDIYLRGSFDRKSNDIHINGYWLFNDDPEMVETVFFTMYHELMHKRQWNAFTVKSDFGYSEDLLIKWGWSFENYIPAEVDDFLYRNQPVEYYAFAFVNELRNKYNNKLQ